MTSPHRSEIGSAQPVSVPSEPPPLAPDHSARGRAPRSGVRVLLFISFVALLSGVVGVVLVLPGMVEQRHIELAPPATPQSVVEDRSVATERARQKREAERILGLVLRQQTALEAQQVRTWAEAEYATALDRLAEGDVLFAQRDYPAAADAYTAVQGQLTTLAASKPERLAGALASGAQALAAYDAAAAERHFALALAVDPDNATALQGRGRAATIAQLADLLRTGAAQEERGELKLAQQSYEEAVRLDPEAPEARDALSRVSAQIGDRDFREAMSAALMAVEKHDYTEARQALARARAIRPDAPALRDARARLEAAEQRARLSQHRAAAAVLERNERWHRAVEEYTAALAIDPHAQFAREGLTRSQQRAALDDALDVYLHDPSRLHSEAPLQEAVRLQERATTAHPRGPKLEAKLASLQRLIARAEIPIPVRLRSNNETSVVVYRVGRFGTFTERTLLLTPGTYTAHGSRDGYRDVQVRFTVVADEHLPPVVVSCEEEI